MQKDYLLVIGVMTGNSLDGVDVCLTKISENGSFEDLVFYYEKNSDKLIAALKDLSQSVKDCNGVALKAEEYFNRAYRDKHGDVDNVNALYLHSLANCIKKLIETAKNNPELSSKYDLNDIDLIGLHGQTCSHLPPSVAGSKDKNDIYTVQFGDGQELSDILDIPVVYDFRSDDLMNGGEAAPLAPAHHAHLAQFTKANGYYPIAFCNAGNTGNLSIVTFSKSDKNEIILGWDTGPFNHFADLMVKKEKNISCDVDGRIGMFGKVVPGFLKILFDKSALTKSGENFITKSAPKSSDPSWYDLPIELDDIKMSFVNRLRTVEYFAVYAFFYNLTLIPDDIEIPRHLALCGGGWKNPIVKNHFEALLRGDYTTSPVLPLHQKLFKEFSDKNKFECNLSSYYGFDENAMEARIFADAAVCRIKKQAFTSKEITGVKKPVVMGLLKFPHNDIENASDNLKEWIKKYDSLSIMREAVVSSPRWSRASAGWSK